MFFSWQRLWDAWCIFSIIGIWPRFIEPHLLSVTKFNVEIPNLPPALSYLKILQFSDLHWSQNYSKSFIKKCIHKINFLEPDLIVFTGDFLCRAKLQNPTTLKNFLCSLNAKIGMYAVLGNHDYENFITVNNQGDYDIEEPTNLSNIQRGFGRLFSKITLTKKVALKAQNVNFNRTLMQVLKETPFQLLHNENKLIPIGNSYLNICGLGEYMAGYCDPKKAFKEYDHNFPGIALIHNPDGMDHLKDSPVSLILSGHTHGGQINLPLIKKKLNYLENYEFIRGLKKSGDKWIHINRGIGSTMQFRWFALPEISLITLKNQNVSI